MQPWVIVGVALLFYSFQCAVSLIVNLQDPFAARSDAFDADATLCAAEMTLWTLLRGGFRARPEGVANS